MRRSVSAIALCALAGPAIAQVEAADVWEDLRTGAEAWGYTVDSAAVDIGEDDVSITDLTFTYVGESEAPSRDREGETVDVTTEIVVTLPSLRIVEEGETAVIELPGAMPFRMTGMSTEMEEGRSGFGGTLAQEGMRLTVAEQGEAKVYSYTANAMTMTLDEIDDPTAPETFDVSIRLEELAGDTRTSDDAEGRRVSEQSVGAARMTISADISDTGGEDPGTLALAAAYSNLSGGGTAVLPRDVDMNDIAAALDAGFDVTSDISVGAGRTEMEFTSPEGSFSYASNSQGGTFEVVLSPEILRYGITSRGGDTSIVGSNIPVPEIAYAVDSTRFVFEVPPMGSDEPQAFGLDLAVRGLALNESLWSLFDPQGVLPRDPANLVLDLAGSAVFPEGLMEMSGGQVPGAEPPVLDRLEIERLEISLAGAAIIGRALLSGTPDGAPVAPGLPPVQGTAELSATGINALMDGLAQIGLVPPQQGAMVRGMLGFIARPTGEDSYATELEIGPGGLTANGMPLR